MLTDLSNLLVQADLRRDRRGEPARRRGGERDAGGHDHGQALSATVAEIDPTSTTSNGVVDYGVTLALTQHAAGLKPGESVSVSVITGEANNALYVPATAVTTSGTSSTVVVIGPNNAEQTVPVTLGVQGSTDDQILTGLTLGEKVLTSTATAGTGTGTGGFPFRGGGGLGGGGLGGGGSGRGRRSGMIRPSRGSAAAARGPAAGRAGTGRAQPQPVIRLVSVVKTYGSGEAAVQALRGVSLDVVRAGLRGDHGRVRLRQVDA